MFFAKVKGHKKVQCWAFGLYLVQPFEVVMLLIIDELFVIIGHLCQLPSDVRSCVILYCYSIKFFLENAELVAWKMRLVSQLWIRIAQINSIITSAWDALSFRGHDNLVLCWEPPHASPGKRFYVRQFQVIFFK